MKTILLLTTLLVPLGCDRSGGGSPDRRPPLPEMPGPSVPESPSASPPDATLEDDTSSQEPTCEELLRAVAAAVDEASSERQGCQWDHQCVQLPVDIPCFRQCPTTVAARALVDARAALTRIGGGDDCATVVSGRCGAPQPSCVEQIYFCNEGTCATRPASDPAPERSGLEIPEENARARDDDPPARPEAGAAEERARRLFDAIVNDDPERAADFFLPREAFLELKGIVDPGGYWDRLFARYMRDIHSLHQNLPDIEQAEFLRFDLVRRGGWVKTREEGNTLPYWVSRHSWIHYRVGEQERRLEVRVLITWGNEWYVTHLCEFHCEERDCCRPPD